MDSRLTLFPPNLRLQSQRDHQANYREHTTSVSSTNTVFPAQLQRITGETHIITETEPAALSCSTVDESPWKTYRALFTVKIGGSAGEVFYQAHRSSDDTYGMALLKEVSHGTHEVEILKRYRHQNIIQLMDIFSANDKVFVSLEFVETSLNSLLACLTLEENHMAVICREILQALSFLHRNGIQHGSLRPASVFMSTKGEIKLSNFGSSAMTSDTTLLDMDIDDMACCVAEMISPLQRSPRLSRGSGTGRSMKMFCNALLNHDRTTVHLLAEEWVGLHLTTKILIPLVYDAKLRACRYFEENHGGE